MPVRRDQQAERFLRSTPQRRFEQSLDRWFDTSVFSIPAQFTIGNAGRGLFFGPGLMNFDVNIGKRFVVPDARRRIKRGVSRRVLQPDEHAVFRQSEHDARVRRHSDVLRRCRVRRVRPNLLSSSIFESGWIDADAVIRKRQVRHRREFAHVTIQAS